MSQDTATMERTAREVFPGFAEADREFDAMSAAMPAFSAPQDAWDGWYGRRDRAKAALESLAYSAKGLMCARCGGRGRLPQYRHRSNGLCYKCNGDGWTAKGRQWWLKQRAGSDA